MKYFNKEDKRKGNFMEKRKKIVTILLIVLISILSINLPVKANDTTNSLRRLEYSQEFIDWLNLSEEEKEKVLIPKVYNIEDTKIQTKNPLYYIKSLATSLNPKYNLKDVIPNNIVVRNQQQTNSCWAFASLAALESNIALLNQKEGETSKTYDFSERHMEYATSRFFANDEENLDGYNRGAGTGGNWFYAESYLTNGSGAVDETSMPFENNEDTISLSQIQNKEITSQVYDTRDFSTSNSEENRNEIKEHIQNYGAVFAGLHGANLFAQNCYNNDTGAIYCDNSILYPSDHAVAIIGWDDDYAIENFNEKLRPTTKGAWIIKNSWGEKDEYELQELKQEIFNAFEEECKAQGWNDAASIPNEFIEQAGYTIEDNKAWMKIGDNGIMYVSYEDVNIYDGLYGIVKASDTTSYENIYQYDKYYPFGGVSYLESEIMLSNIFEKKTTGNEYLTQVSLYAPEAYTCKVYVNPNGISKDKKDLKLVSLKAGETESFDAGYHTLEFSKPIAIKADHFAVVIEIQGTRSNEIDVMLESKFDEVPQLDVVEVESGKCFLAGGNDLENCEWIDLGNLTEVDASLINGDSTIKAFTVTKTEEDILESIEITTPPTKTEYVEGESFDKTGMVVTAKYSSGKSSVITDYTVSNGTNLKVDQKSVTISYEDETVEQPITVKKKTGTDDNEEQLAKNSNFNNVSCKVNGLKYYIFTDDANKEYILLDVTVNGFEKNKENDSYEYYYYLSTKPNEADIKDWVKITENQSEDDKLEFRINTNDMKNLEELTDSEADTLYLYVKEVVKKGENQSTAISKAMELDGDAKDVSMEIYIDNEKIDLSDIEIGGDNGSQNKGPQTTDSTSKPQKDQTVAQKQLPKTGMKGILVVLIVISVVGAIFYIRYKNLNKYIK